jgi:hypothetical protein
MKLLKIIVMVLIILSLTIAADARVFKYEFKGNNNWLLTYKMDSEIEINGNSSSFSVSGRQKIKITHISTDKFKIHVTCEKQNLNLGDGPLNDGIKKEDFGLLLEGQVYEAIYNSYGELQKTIQEPSNNFKYNFISKISSLTLKVGKTTVEKEEFNIPRIGKSDLSTRTKFVSEENGIGKFRQKGKMIRRNNKFDANITAKFIFDFNLGYIPRMTSKTDLIVTLNDYIIKQTIYFNSDIREEKIIKKTKDEFDW